MKRTITHDHLEQALTQYLSTLFTPRQMERVKFLGYNKLHGVEVEIIPPQKKSKKKDES